MAIEALAATEQLPSNFNSLPPSSEALEKRVYSPEEEKQIAQLMPLAEIIATDPEIARLFGVMKWENMGDSDRDKRFSGRHPLPEREIDGKKYVYSVPVVAGLMPWKDEKGETQYTAISVMKDNWRGDSKAWRVFKLHLQAGKRPVERAVTGVVIDASRRAEIVLRPYNWENIPPLSRPTLDRVPMYNLERITVKLDGKYHAWEAMYRPGLLKSYPIIDIGYLEEAMARQMGVRIDEEVFGDYRQSPETENTIPSAITAAQYIVGATVKPAYAGTV